jgi:hypothetical protein
MKIEFAGEAYESFQRVVDEIRGFTVEITSIEGATFDAVVHGTGDGQWGDEVIVQHFNEEQAAGVGDPFPVRVERLLVY